MSYSYQLSYALFTLMVTNLNEQMNIKEKKIEEKEIKGTFRDKRVTCALNLHKVIFFQMDNQPTVNDSLYIFVE